MLVGNKVNVKDQRSRIDLRLLTFGMINTDEYVEQSAISNIASPISLPHNCCQELKVRIFIMILVDGG